MSDEFLERAARALRDQAAELPAGDGPSRRWQAMGSWSGVLRDVHRARRRRRRVVVAGLQLVLALAGLGAWAAVSGRLPAIFRPILRPAPAAAPTAAASHRAPRARRTAYAPPAAAPLAAAPDEDPEPPEAGDALAVAPLAPEAAPPTPPAPPTPADAPPPVRRRPEPLAPPIPRAAPETPPASVAAPVAPVPPDGDALYRAAHAAHFARHDYAAALAAWDRYLASGAGPLAPEALYNRAIALARLGRRDEAAAALAPFAAGDYGSYRQQEARALLGLLRAPP